MACRKRAVGRATHDLVAAPKDRAELAQEHRQCFAVGPVLLSSRLEWRLTAPRGLRAAETALNGVPRRCRRRAVCRRCRLQSFLACGERIL